MDTASPMTKEQRLELLKAVAAKRAKAKAAKLKKQEYMREYAKSHKPQYRDAKKRWAAAHPDRVRKASARRLGGARYAERTMWGIDGRFPDSAL